MGDERNENLEEEINEDNDAREEDIVEDEDADTRDVEDTENENREDIENRFSEINATLDRILGELASLREAQGILVENGAVVNDTETEIDLTPEDAFVPPAELDLII